MIAQDLKFCLKNGISSYSTSINLPDGEELHMLKKLQNDPEEGFGDSTDTDGSRNFEHAQNTNSKKANWLGKRSYAEFASESANCCASDC